MRLFEMVDNPKEIISLIKRDCQSYLDQISDIDGARLKRGMTFNVPFKKMNAVGDGRNEDMHDDEWEKLADQWFVDKFGFHARSQSVYCAGGKKMAGRYGLPYSVFPIGDFKFVWSPVVEDLYYPFKRSGGDIGAVKEAMETGKYSDANLNAAVLSQKHEIMVYCPSGYYAVRDDYFDDLLFRYRPF